ncbi:MAG: YbaK/EbsC family protein [Dehalococcoidia bacterium]
MTGIELHQVVLAALDNHGIAYEPMACDPDLADTAAFCAAYGIPLEDSANTILVASKSTPPVYAACLVLAHTRLDVNRAVRQRLGARKASFASTDDTVALTGMLIGGVTIFGLPADMPIWVDSRVLGRERVIVGGGNRSSKVIVRPDELRKLPDLEFVEDLAVLPSP